MHRQRKELTTEQVRELQVAQDSCADAMTAMRYQAVRLYGIGYAVKMVQEICGCSQPSLMEWNRKYHQIGVAGLLDQRQGGNRARLREEELERLQQKLHQYQPYQLFSQAEYTGDGRFWCVKTLACLVQQEFSVTYKTANSYRALFEKCDFSYQRTTQQYLSRSELKGVAFEEELEKN